MRLRDRISMKEDGEVSPPTLHARARRWFYNYLLRIGRKRGRPRADQANCRHTVVTSDARDDSLWGLWTESEDLVS